MKRVFLAVVVLLMTVCLFGEIACLKTTQQNLEATTPLNCDAYCESARLEENPYCQCPPLTVDPNNRQVDGRTVKRDTLEDLVKKINKNNKIPANSLKLRTAQKPKMTSFQKKWPTNFQTKKKAVEPPQMLKELQDRLKELRMRMSGKPQLLRMRGNFNEEEPPNLIEQFKSKQEEFKEKIRKQTTNLKASRAKNANNTTTKSDGNRREDVVVGSPRTKNPSPKENLLLRGPKEDAPTPTSTPTAASSRSQLPVIVLMPSSTSTTAVPSEQANKNNVEELKQSSAIERLKEKQKEAVTKIKDKISVGKIKSKDIKKEQAGNIMS